MIDDIPFCGNGPRGIVIPRPGGVSLSQVINVSRFAGIQHPPSPCVQGLSLR